MPELGPYGSVRGARGNSRPYRESCRGPVEPTRMTPTETLAAPKEAKASVIRTVQEIRSTRGVLRTGKDPEACGR
jgi:hypothetical protein